MKIKALFFASSRDIVGSKEVELDIPEGVNVGDLRRDLIVRYPGLAPLQQVLSVAVNTDYADDSALLKQGDEVAFIPPVSGG